MNADAVPASPPPAAPPRAGMCLPVLLAGVLLGTAWQLQQPRLWPWQGYAALLLLALLAGAPWCWRARRGLRLRHLAALLVLAAGAQGAVCGLRAAAFAATALEDSLQGQDVQVQGVVAAMVQPHDDGVRLRLEVEAARHDGAPVRLPALIDLGWYADVGRGHAVPALQPGQRWRLAVRLKAPHGASNPHGFDYELWLWEQGVQATGYVRSSARLDALHGAPQLLGQTWRHPVEWLRQQVRDAIVRRLQLADAGAARQSAAGVVAALVTGDQRAIERSDWDLFRATGVAHLMSISGLHITLFAWLAALLLGWLWRRSSRLCLAVPAPVAGVLGGVALAVGYALFSGWGVPAQRTVLMLAAVGLLRLSGKRWPWPLVWLLACAVVLLADPWAMLQAGFWLSFVAVAVLFASGVPEGGARRAGVPGHVHALLREQWVVTLALTPLSLLLFGQVSLVGLLANLLAIPWVTLVVTPLALAGVLWAPLWQAAAWCVQLLLAPLQWLASWPWAQLHLPMAPLWAGIAAAAGGVLLALRLPWGVRALGLPLVLAALLWQVPRPAPGQFDVLAADVGQGQAVLVRTAGHSLLYDAGPRFVGGDAGERVLVPLLYALGERLDMLVLSHGDEDHTGGAPAVLARQAKARVLGSLQPGHPVRGLRPVTACTAGQAWDWDGVRFTVLHPPPEGQGAAARAQPGSNGRSCVLRIEVSGRAGAPGAAAILAGDLERAQEQELVAAAAPLRADLLLVPHHGSKTSSSAAFIDAVQPHLALVQAGYRNRFGHPAPTVAARYRERGIPLVATPQCGAAQWSSAAARQWRCWRESAPHYWQYAGR